MSFQDKSLISYYFFKSHLCWSDSKDIKVTITIFIAYFFFVVDLEALNIETFAIFVMDELVPHGFDFISD